MIVDKQSNGTARHQVSQNGTPHASAANHETTDIQRWRLLDERGQQTWHYLETAEQVKAWPQSTADRYHLGLPLVSKYSDFSISRYTQNTNLDIVGLARLSKSHDTP